MCVCAVRELQSITVGSGCCSGPGDMQVSYRMGVSVYSQSESGAIHSVRGSLITIVPDFMKQSVIYPKSHAIKMTNGN